MTLLERNQEYMKIENAVGLIEEYNILAAFPFSSDSKRMGILIQQISTNRIIFFLKGADMVMIDRCKPLYRGYIQD